MLRSVGRCVLAALLALSTAPHSAPAQESGPLPIQNAPRPAWRGEAETIGVNVLLGALTSATARAVRGEPVWRGVWEGAAGGAVMYAGKRVAVEHASGAGLLGRQLAAVGASVVRNSSLGEPALSRVVLPLGPVRLYVAPGSETPVHARLDLASAVVTAYAVLDGDVRFDAGATLSAGAPVFYRVAGFGTARHGAGVVWLPNPDFSDAYGAIFAHERVHVLQYDAGFIAGAEPIERWLFARVPGGERIGRYVDVGLNVAAWGALNLAIDYESRPWEREAYFLTRVRPEAGRDGGFRLAH